MKWSLCGYMEFLCFSPTADLTYFLSTCQAGEWNCGDAGSQCGEMELECAEGEVPCRESGHCVPQAWLCDNQDDCGDGSDEEGNSGSVSTHVHVPVCILDLRYL